VIYPDDYGVHFYSDLIFTTEELVETQPDLVTRFLRASLKGWTFALENTAQAGALVQNYDPELEAELEEVKLTTSLPLINTGEDQIGWMKPEVWAGMEQTLREQKALVRTLDLGQVYTLQFLQEIYK
jgi:NitT/TauT family transport system substrate-binding protein